ncbi:MAG: hypothetical protein IPP03_07135 [Dechloromonas sp.]|nr:hypothetical protein [Candidatus Dechloromonas phosphoritropha]MBP8789300.1 hypothetical protein [Azonexus sp.]MBP9226582.1 hypothetical protein [Azonexus sp.]
MANALFCWEDPLLLDAKMNEDERMLREAVREYCPDSLLPRVLEALRYDWWHRLDSWLLILALDLAGYANGIFANLWDVLFDPLLMLVALVIVIRHSAISGKDLRVETTHEGMNIQDQ